MDEIDVFEINESFASEVCFCVERLDLPLDKVNPNGGAIAIGHPIGCTGARQLTTLLHELKRRGRRSVCCNVKYFKLKISSSLTGLTVWLLWEAVWGWEQLQ